MHAGVALTNRLHPVRRDLPPRLLVAQQVLDFGSHGLAIRNADVILARPEQTLRILPWRADQGGTAGERFEDADCGNSTEPVCILPAGNVQRESRLGIGPRGAQVWQIAAIFNSCRFELPQCLLWIAHAVRHNPALSLKRRGGFYQEFFQLSTAFFVAPIPNPEYVIYHFH